MRSDIVRLVGGVLWLLVFAMIASERRIVRTLRRHGATSPDTAAPLAVRSPLTRWRLGRLVRAGAIVGSISGQFYLDHHGFERYNRNRRRRALTVLAVIVPLLVVVWWMSSL